MWSCVRSEARKDPVRVRRSKSMECMTNPDDKASQPVSFFLWESILGRLSSVTSFEALEHMEVSSRGSPKSYIQTGLSTMNYPFWGIPLLWKHSYDGTMQ